MTGEQDPSTKISSFYASSYDEVASSFEEYKFAKVVKGKCPEVLCLYYDYFKHMPIRFLHVDLNYYKAEIESLSCLFPFLDDGAIIILDDYANLGREIQSAAFDRFFSDKGLPILTSAAGQGIVINRKARI
jgi:hypothetical protein